MALHNFSKVKLVRILHLLKMLHWMPFDDQALIRVSPRRIFCCRERTWRLAAGNS